MFGCPTFSDKPLQPRRQVKGYLSRYWLGRSWPAAVPCPPQASPMENWIGFPSFFPMNELQFWDVREYECWRNVIGFGPKSSMGLP